MKFNLEMINTINETAELTRVYLTSGNEPSNEEFSLWTLSDNSIDVGGTNRNSLNNTIDLFTDNSEVDRYDIAVGVVYLTEDGYDTDEDGLTDFLFEEVSQTLLEDYPDDVLWNKEYFGNAVDSTVLKIKFENDNVVIYNNKSNNEYKIKNIVENWDEFYINYKYRLFDITDLFKFLDLLKAYKINDSFNSILEAKNIFERNIGIKESDEGRLFVSLENIDILYTKNHNNYIVPTRLERGNSYAIEYAINKDYEAGLLMLDGE